MPDSGVSGARRSAIWRAITGGGLHVEFLRWLAAQWHLYAQDRAMNGGEEDFDFWLAARFNTTTGRATA